MINHLEKYQKLSEKYNLPLDVIQKIVDSQFEFTKEVISSGNDEQVYLQHLGKFLVKPGRREHVQRKREHIKKVKDGCKKGRYKK